MASNFNFARISRSFVTIASKLFSSFECSSKNYLNLFYNYITLLLLRYSIPPSSLVPDLYDFCDPGEIPLDFLCFYFGDFLGYSGESDKGEYPLLSIGLIMGEGRCFGEDWF